MFLRCLTPRRLIRWNRTPAFIALALLTLACGVASNDTPPSSEDALGTQESAPIRSVTLHEETLTLEDGTTLPYERGVIDVPGNRASGAESMIEVEFFRFRRTSEAAADPPPLFLLHGGPGFDGLGPRLERPGYFENRLAPYTQITDLIVPGQRGFGSSTGTPCDDRRELSVEEVFDDEVLDQAFREAAKQCQAKWEAEGLDLNGFNAVEAAADLVDIARALEYEQIQLLGSSFGSHWAMTTLRYHPDQVAWATLSGLEGPDHTYDMPSWKLAALQRIATSAEASPELAASMPEGGLLAAYQELIRQADDTPLIVEVPHPETDEPVNVQMQGDDVRDMLAASTSFTAFRIHMQPWPTTILSVANGQYEPAAAELLEIRLDPRIRDAAFFMIDCASGISQGRGKELRGDPAADTLGRTWKIYDTACGPWDADLGEAFRQPFTSDVPVLMVQGNWDTSTPYENAVELRPFFTHHRFVHVEGGSHGALREAIEEVKGFEEAVFHWLATGDMTQIPERVELPPMEWTR